MALYEIKPLEWKEEDISGWSDLKELWKARTPICHFEAEKMVGGDCYYKYCFDEYFDDGSGICSSVEDGKAKCEAIWAERIKKCLIEVGEEGVQI